MENIENLSLKEYKLMHAQNAKRAEALRVKLNKLDEKSDNEDKMTSKERKAYENECMTIRIKMGFLDNINEEIENLTEDLFDYYFD